MTIFSRPTRYRLAAAVGTSIAAVIAVATPALADVSAVGGGAFGESVYVTRAGQSQQISGPTPTVTLPANGGGPFTDSLAGMNLAHALTSSNMGVSTQGSLGATGAAWSSASISNLNAFDGLVTVQSISSQCRSDSTGSTASSTINGLVVQGQAINPANIPNTVPYDKNGLKVVFNEQTKKDKPHFADIKVTAVHVSLTTLAGTSHLLLSQSTCHAEGPNVIIPLAPFPLLIPLSIALVILVAVSMTWWRSDLAGPAIGEMSRSQQQSGRFGN